MTTALYPGSFDPVTKGHLDIVTRAASVFDRLVVAVFATPAKDILFSPQERLDLLRKSIDHLTNVEVTTYNGLTIDFAKKIDAKVIVRGLRMVSDFDYEFEMAMMNRKLAPDLDVVFLMTSLEHQFISSSLLKEVAKLGGDISGLVPAPVAAALSKKLGLHH